MKRTASIKNKASGLTVDEMAVIRDEREAKAGRSFDDSVALFVKLCLEKLDKHYNNRHDPVRWVVRLWSEDGPRYVRIRKRVENAGWDTGVLADNQIYAFIDKLTGDVLKPASWKAAAKHARGNIFDEDPSASCNFHGPGYLR